jgi:hypothetical protein
VGLGTSATRTGKRIGETKAREILALFGRIPACVQHAFRHFEEIQFFIEGFSRDRISDICCSFLKSFLIDFTIQQCDKVGIPRNLVDVENVYDYRRKMFETRSGVELPVNPTDGSRILLVPKRWLRFVPWISYDEYFEKCPQDEISHQAEQLTHVEVLTYNHHNLGVVDNYVKTKERSFQDCHNDPLFSQIPITSAKRKFALIKKLPTGKEGGADKKYEDAVGQLLPSLLYPKLDCAKEQARTDSGVSIRDLIFYNTASTPFLNDMYKTYGARQITMELKNVATIVSSHVDQLNRYLADELEKFGILVTRGELAKAERTRAFEVEHTTAIYSGLLRVADVLAFQPNMDIALHIVAPDEKREKVFREFTAAGIRAPGARPVSAQLQLLVLRFCKGDRPHPLKYMRDSLLDEYTESPDAEE